MTLAAHADIFGPGSRALALARQAWGGRGFFTSVRRRLPDGSWLGAPDAPDIATLALIAIPYAFGEPDEERRKRLAAIGERSGGPEASAIPGSVRSATSALSLVPTPVGEAQGLDTIAFFTACRMALPEAHVVVDLELLGHKLGQLCLSFGADEIMGSIVNQRELRLGARANSNELTREEAARLLRAAGFEPCERSPASGVSTP